MAGVVALGLPAPLGLGTGVAWHWESFPKAQLSADSSCPWLSREGLGGCLPCPLGPGGRSRLLERGAGRGNPEQSVDRWTAVTAIVSVQTRLWFGSCCLAVGFSSSEAGIHAIHLWFANMSMTRMHIFGVLNRQ